MVRVGIVSDLIRVWICNRLEGFLEVNTEVVKLE